MTERVQSYTQPGVFYDLTIKSGLAINCTCPDCVGRNRVCKHMKDYNNGVVAARMAVMRTLAQNVLTQYRSGVAEPEGVRTLEAFLGVGYEATTEEPVVRTDRQTIVIEIRVM